MIEKDSFYKWRASSVGHNWSQENILSDGLKVTIYRIIQNSSIILLNILPLPLLTFELNQNIADLTLMIEDNGKRFDVRAKRNGIGLANIVSRAEIYNGRARIKSSRAPAVQY